MPHPEQPSYEELAARNAELTARVAEQAALIESLRTEVAALRWQAGRDSSNSSQPPSQDGPAGGAKAAKRAARRARPARPQGGQKGHPGASLAWAAGRMPGDVTAVFWGACHGGRHQCAEYLLDRGAELNSIPPWENLTPLDAAEREHATGLMQWLRARGATTAARRSDPAAGSARIARPRGRRASLPDAG